jgi:hypothetical protein
MVFKSLLIAAGLLIRLLFEEIIEQLFDAPVQLEEEIIEK